MDEVTTKSTRFWIEDGIIKSRPLRPYVLTGELAIESVKAMEMLSAGRRLPRLAFLDEVLYVERAAREMYAQDQRSVGSIAALALVAESCEAKRIAEFVVAVTERTFPVEVFHSEEPAIEWLREQTEFAD
jgi:hypothetical protein